jgi:hypothetical protein
MYRLSVHIEPVTINNRQVTTLSFHGMKANQVDSKLGEVRNKYKIQKYPSGPKKDQEMYNLSFDVSTNPNKKRKNGN